MARMSILSASLYIMMVLTGTICVPCSAQDPGFGASSCELEADKTSLLQQQTRDIAISNTAISKNMKVVFGLMTSPKPKWAAELAAVEETWGKDVAPHTLLIIGNTGSTPGVVYNQAPMCEDGHTNNAGNSCKEATIIADGHKMGADWVVVGATDMYIFPKRFHEMLAKENPSEAKILGIFGCGGGNYCEDHKPGLCGGGGYAISRGAMEKMVGDKQGATQSYVQECMDTSIRVCGNWSDQVTACVARRSHVKQVELEGLYGWKLASEDIYKEKISLSTPPTLTFHYVDPKLMHTIHNYAKAETAVTLVQPDHAVAYEDQKRAYEDERAAYIQMSDKERFASAAA